MVNSVYQFGTFDVANYGDLLFPLLAQKRLASFNMKIVPVSPKSSLGVWADCMPTVGVSEIDPIAPPDAILIGGGNIITLMPTSLPDYNLGNTSLSAYSDLWVGASCLALEGVPICWNAPGVSVPFTKDQIPFVCDCLDRVNYISVRDEESRRFLLEAKGSEISVVPDPGWDLPNLWANEELSISYQQAFITRNQTVPSRSFAVHLNSRYTMSASEEKLAGLLDQVSEQINAHPILLAIGPCHGDDELIQRVGKHMRSSPLIIDQPNALREIAACISHSQIYIGSSMHGLITALSFAVPALCVMPGKLPKFKGLKSQLVNQDVWLNSWNEVPQKIQSMNMTEIKLSFEKVSDEKRKILDQHWTNIIAFFTTNCCYQKNDKHILEKQLKSKIAFWTLRANIALTETAPKNGMNDKYKQLLADSREELDKLQKELADLHKYKNLYKKITKRLAVLARGLFRVK